MDRIQKLKIMDVGHFTAFTWVTFVLRKRPYMGKDVFFLQIFVFIPVKAFTSQCICKNPLA